jgi:L-rhamnose isomerase
MHDHAVEAVWKALDQLKIELPSWGFANTGTRFGKFIQPAAATTIEEKFSDAAGRAGGRKAGQAVFHSSGID